MDTIITNTSLREIINEQDLYDVIKSGHLSNASIDFFEKEPYLSPLKEIERCFLTFHIGYIPIDCKTKMEIEAKEEALTGKALEREVLKVECEVQGAGL